PEARPERSVERFIGKSSRVDADPTVGTGDSRRSDALVHKNRPIRPFITAEYVAPREKTMSSVVAWIRSVNGLMAKLEWLAAPLALATRVYVSWVFLKSGYLKISDWGQTLSLFHDEYRVPVLPPDLAAVLGTGGELLFPLLLIPGVMGRVGAVG